MAFSTIRMVSSRGMCPEDFVDLTGTRFETLLDIHLF